MQLELGAAVFEVARLAPDATTSGGWWLSFLFDGEDEEGDPSGLTVVVAGVYVGLYWPMRRRIEVGWGLGERLRIVRW